MLLKKGVLLSIAAACLLGWNGAVDAVGLKFIIPSGATSEASRFYADLAREFERAEPDIKIDFRPLNNWDDVILAVSQLSRKNQNAGLFVAEVSETLELERLGLITPFETAFEQYGGPLKKFTATLTPEFLGNSYCATGHFCGPPFVRSTPVALYNLDMIKAAGVSANALPTTWSELEALLEKLKPLSPQPPFAFGGDWYDYLFEATVRQAGGALMDAQRRRVTFSTPEAVEALKFWRRLKDKGLMSRSNNWKATLNGFIGGFYGVTYYSSGGMETVRARSKFAWMADMLPKNRTYGVAVGGGNLYLSAGLGEAETRAALKFASFLYRPAVQARISSATGFFPVVEEAYAETELKERYARDEPFVRVRQQLKYANPKLMTVNNLKVRDILKTAIDRCLDEGVAAEQALLQAQQSVDRLLGQ